MIPSRPRLRPSFTYIIALMLSLVTFFSSLMSPARLAAATQVLDEGIQYNQLVKTLEGDREALVNYLLVDPSKPKVELKPVLAGNALGNLDTLSNLVKEYGAVAGVNGTFYSMSGNYTPIDTTIIDHQLLVKSQREATSLVCFDDRRIMFEPVNLQVDLVLPDKKLVFNVNTFNQNCQQGIALFTPQFGKSTKTGPDTWELVAEPDRQGRLSVTQVVYGNAFIPEDGFVISMQGEEKPYRQYFALGDRVYWSLDLQGYQGVKHLLANGPLLVKNGCRTVPIQLEQLDSSLGYRHPRTALGLTKSGKVLLVTVDGRSEESMGMTFNELADLLIELGADQAMALDGGGSTEMVVEGKIINKPSDGRERRINTAILIISQIPVYLNGQRVYFEVAPINQNGRVLVPVRKLFEALGAEVEWNGETRTVSAVQGQTRVDLPIGKKTARINGKSVQIDAAAIIVENRTMVPVRFISQALGAKVWWDAATQSVHIKT
ncbi:MAG: phosphodiester glycosidase family protein [Syntrophomonadaceae bacterium]|nr:phosphodiester glycosidase family protein [Syntrophomonadaceae bacterium]